MEANKVLAEHIQICLYNLYNQQRLQIILLPSINKNTESVLRLLQRLNAFFVTVEHVKQNISYLIVAYFKRVNHLGDLDQLSHTYKQTMSTYY